MSFLARGLARFWSGTPKRPILNSHPSPWPAPRRPNFRPTPPPKPTTLIGKIKSYIPGRNWLIFGGIVTSWVSLATYDRKQTRLRVEDYCRLVEHLSRRRIGMLDPVPGVSVWVCSPPGDQLKWNKDVWRQFVKPVIVAAGYDYSLHLNSRQGAARTAMRKNIFEHREQQGLPPEQRRNIRETEGGDIIVVGRNTFKEIIRGVEEGYLLPPDYVAPIPPPEPEKPEGDQKDETPSTPPLPDVDILPAIPESEYASLPDPPDSPSYIFTYVPSLHILGVRHTPRRIYRFLTRRYLADEICGAIVAALLDQAEREWTEDDLRHGQAEERFWPKTVKPDAEWRQELRVDARIRPRLRWRTYSPVFPVPEFREQSAPTAVGDVEELRSTEEEVARDERIREEMEAVRKAARERRLPFSSAFYKMRPKGPSQSGS